MILYKYFPNHIYLKQGDVLPPLLFNCYLKCAVMKVRENEVGWKLDGTSQLLVYADNATLSEDNKNTTKKTQKL
jgi:hypothetical protein